MRKGVLLAALLAVLTSIYAGVPVAARDVVPFGPTLVITIDGSSGLVPKTLSKTGYTPVALTAAGSIRNLESHAPHPAPLKEILIDAKNVVVFTKGYPICTGGKRQSRTENVREVCSDSIVGSGSIGVSVMFPDQTPVPATSPLLVFNGGTSDGTTTLYVHAFLIQPITTAIIIPVKIKKSSAGIKATATIPKIANGAGSVTDFSLRIDKKFTYKGQKHSVVSARCVGGKIQANVVAKFYDNSQLSADVLRTCTSKP